MVDFNKWPFKVLSVQYFLLNRTLASFTPDVRIESESAVTLVFGKTYTPALSEKILTWQHGLEANPFIGFLEAIPALLTLTVYFDPFAVQKKEEATPAQWVANWLYSHPPQRVPLAAPAAAVFSIPVYYGGQFGPDLEKVAQTTGLPKEEIIRLHTAVLHEVAFIGFAPGFPYLHGLSPELEVPRLATPRPHVAAGSVAIANAMTCIYPRTSPGGWNVIGYTPVRLFDPFTSPPARLSPGCLVRFTALPESG